MLRYATLRYAPAPSHRSPRFIEYIYFPTYIAIDVSRFASPRPENHNHNHSHLHSTYVQKPPFSPSSCSYHPIPPLSSPSSPPNPPSPLFRPFNQRQNINKDSQSALAPIGGNFSPSFSTRGSHVHHCSRGVAVITDGMWLPQPHQVCFSIEQVGLAEWEKGEREGGRGRRRRGGGGKRGAKGGVGGQRKEREGGKRGERRGEKRRGGRRTAGSAG